MNLSRLVHTECAVPPIHQGDAWAILHRFNHYQLMCFVSTVNDKVSTQYRATHIESVECTNVAACITDSGAQVTKCARHVVELTIERDGKGGGGQSWHKSHKVIPNPRSATPLFSSSCA